jgi:hypothetical protein
MDPLTVLTGVLSGAASGACWSVVGYAHAVGNDWKAGRPTREAFDVRRLGRTAVVGAVIGAAMAYNGWTWAEAETWAANVGALGVLGHAWKALRGWWALRKARRQTTTLPPPVD